MKVVHISTFDSGGAATAAYRLHRGLCKLGVDSNFICLEKRSSSRNDIIQFIPGKRGILFRAVNKFLPLSQTRKNAETLKKIRKTGKFEIYSFPITDHDLSQNEVIQTADIINLHWVANFINFKSFFSKIRKPIIWTLHDMNPFSGGFHYSNDEIANSVIYKNIDGKARFLKSESIKKSTIKKVVSPSSWLNNESKRSKVFGNTNHYQIKYGLDTNVFRLFDKKLARNIFNIPNEKIVFAFVSEQISNPRKGYDILEKCIDELRSNEDIHFVAIGKSPKKLSPNVSYLGSIADERLLALAYCCADALILPSRQDNLPNVMLESLCCGLPVIGFPVGGIKEVIVSGENGYLCENVSDKSLLNAMRTFIGKPNNFDSTIISTKARGLYDELIQAGRYLNLYTDCLE